MKCRVCRGPAVIDLPRHNANFCAEHLVKLCRDQVAKAIADHHMLAAGERMLVAVSGGKDSLALWDLLGGPGLRGGRAVHRARHRRVQRRLGGGGAGVRRASAASCCASSPSGRITGTTCRRRPPPPVACPVRRAGSPSATCSTARRATAGTRWSPPVTTWTTRPPSCSATPCAGTSSTSPGSCRCCPAHDGFPRKVKPLVRLSERETAAYCIVRGIDYQVEECPLAAGNRHLGYKAALNTVEERSPGTKAAFYLGFLDRMAPLLAEQAVASRALADAGRAAAVLTLRRPDDRRGVRVLPPGRAGGGPRAGHRRAAPEAAATVTDTAERVRVRRQGPGARHQGTPLPGDPEGGWRVPHPRRLLPARRADRPARGDGGQGQPRARQYMVLRPTLEDFVVEMPRGAQVIYPKDLGPILMLADIGPGVRVLESGVGSGALSMTMLRAGAVIVGYELREDFANRARSNVRSFLGADVLDRYHVELRDCYDGIDEQEVDRVVLDLPEPWRVVPHADRRAADRRDPRRLHAFDHAGQPPAGGARRLHGLAGPPHARGAAPHVARGGTGRASGPPDGGPHGLPHLSSVRGRLTTRGRGRRFVPVRAQDVLWPAQAALRPR